MNRKSRRFQPSLWTKWLVPVLLLVLLGVLLITLIVVVLSVAGVTPGV